MITGRMCVRFEILSEEAWHQTPRDIKLATFSELPSLLTTIASEAAKLVAEADPYHRAHRASDEGLRPVVEAPRWGSVARPMPPQPPVFAPAGKGACPLDVRTAGTAPRRSARGRVRRSWGVLRPFGSSASADAEGTRREPGPAADVAPCPPVGTVSSAGVAVRAHQTTACPVAVRV